MRPYDLPAVIDVEADGDVRIVRLNRPEQLNATNHELQQEQQSQAAVAQPSLSWVRSATLNTPLFRIIVTVTRLRSCRPAPFGWPVFASYRRMWLA